jgi:WD40 repeat protein
VPIGPHVRVALALSPDGALLAAGENVVHLWDLRHRDRPPQTLRSSHTCTAWLAFSPDGKTLVSCNHDNVIIFWNVASGKELFTADYHHISSGRMVFSPDSNCLAVIGRLPNSVELWQAPPWMEIEPAKPAAALAN